MVRLFLAVWLAAFAVQSTDLLASIIPDDCVEESQDPAGDPCSDNCARCACCTRLAVFVPHASAPMLTDAPVVADAPRPLTPTTTAVPRGVLHVPRPL